MEASVLRTETSVYPEYQLDIKSSILNIKVTESLGEGHKLLVFKNSHRELGKLYRPKMGEVTAGRTNGSNEELLELNSTPYITKVVK
jgi:hypothetical protein